MLSKMCSQQFKSTCASVQSDQILRCPHEETLHPWLSKMRPVNILIRLRVHVQTDQNFCSSQRFEGTISDVLTSKYVSRLNLSKRA